MLHLWRVYGVVEHFVRRKDKKTHSVDKHKKSNQEIKTYKTKLYGKTKERHVCLNDIQCTVADVIVCER